MGKKNSRAAEKAAASKRNRIILIVVIAIVAAAVIGALIYTLLPDRNEKPAEENKGNTNVDNTPASSDNRNYATLNVSFTDKDGNAQTGDIVIKLRPDCAPITVANFKKLVDEKYYDGTDFFRIVDGMMIQGGENESKSADYIKGEFAANGVNNPLSHVRGTISMARRGSYYDGVPAYDSASSGFFIVQQDYTYWDGQYASFGSVVSGMEYVDMIAGTNLVYSSKYGDIVQPQEPAVINSITLSETLD